MLAGKRVNMIIGINKSKKLTKHTPCKYKCRFEERKCNLDQWRNNDKCRSECKKRYVCEKDYAWILQHVPAKIENILQILWMIQQLFVMTV